MGSNTTTSTGTQQSMNMIPQWMQEAGQKNYALAEDISQQPLQQYQGQMVADVSPQSQQAWNLAANSSNVGSDQFNSATSGYLGALGQKPQSVTAGQLSSTNLAPYMNPFTQSVINTTLPIMQQQLGQNQVGNQNQANAANAFGGSRMGVQQGVTQAQGAMGMANMAAGLNMQNFNQAQAGATGDINRTLQAQQGNQTAAQAKINSDILASQGLTNTGQAMSQANTNAYNNLTSAGAQENAQAQDQINAQMAKFNEARNYPNQQLNTLLAALGMTPSNTASMGTSTQQTTTPTDWAGIAESALGAAGNFAKMSDRRVKKNLTKVGKNAATGIPIFDFNYKGDAPGTPKTRGPMAQDIQKVMPAAVAPHPQTGVLHVAKPILGALSNPNSLMPTPGTPRAMKGIGTMTGGSGQPPSSPGVARGLSYLQTTRGTNAALVNPRAGARAGTGVLANTKRRAPPILGALSG